MATPPPPSPAEVDAAVTRIAARHARHHDQRRHEMGSTPREVLTYLRGRWLRTPDVAYDDIWDELVLDAASALGRDRPTTAAGRPPHAREPRAR